MTVEIVRDITIVGNVDRPLGSTAVIAPPRTYS
jgi:hypothetical protein